MKRENNCYADLFLSGIYFLTHKGKIVYVGESDCIIRRIGEHKNSKVFDNFKFISSKTFFRLDSEQHRLYAEHKCIRWFKPKYNKKGKIYSSKFMSFKPSYYSNEWRIDGNLLGDFYCFGVKEVADELGISMEEAEPIFNAREDELEEKHKEWKKSAQPVISNLPQVVKDKYGGFKFIHKPATKKELGYP